MSKHHRDRFLAGFPGAATRSIAAFLMLAGLSAPLMGQTSRFVEVGATAVGVAPGTVYPYPAAQWSPQIPRPTLRTPVPATAAVVPRMASLPAPASGTGGWQPPAAAVSPAVVQQTASTLGTAGASQPNWVARVPQNCCPPTYPVAAGYPQGVAGQAPALSNAPVYPPGAMNCCPTCPTPGATPYAGTGYAAPSYGVPGYTPQRGGFTPLLPIFPMPQGTYLGQGIIGQPTAYVDNQPLRNLLRYIFP